MATTIQIKRTATTNAPTGLAPGELAFVGGADFGTGERLYLGSPGGAASGELVVGGSFYTRMLDQTPGILTADAAVIVDSNKKINEFYVDDLMLDNNQITTETGNLLLDSNGGTVAVNDNLTVSGTATVTGATTLNSTLAVANTSTLTGDVTMVANATVGGTLGVTGATTLSNTLGVTGATTLNDTLTVAGFTQINNSVAVTGNVDIDGSATVDLGATFKNNIQVAVTDNVTIDTIAGSLTLNSANGITEITDDVNIEGSLDVGVDTTVNGNTTLIGDLDVRSNTIIGVSTAQTITINSQVSSHIVPETDDTWDLGSPLNRWANLYAKSTIFGDIRIAVATDNTIDTATMDLILDSATGNTIINDNLQVNSGTLADINMHTQVNSIDIEDIEVNEVTYAGTNGRMQGDIKFRYFSSSTTLLLDDLRFDNNEVFTNAGNLVLDSATGTTQVDDNLDVVGTSQLNMATTVGTPTTNANLTVNGNTSVTGTMDVDGQSTHASMNVEDLTATRITFAGTAGELEDDANFTFDKATGKMSLTGDAQIDNLNIDGNDITATSGDDINMTVSATGTVRVPVGYEFNANFGATSLTNKSYVDQVAQGLDVKQAVQLATTAPLTGTYTEPTLTGSGALTIDGVVAQVGWRILVKDQANQIQNGIYDVTAADGSSWTLTRSGDADNASNAYRGNEVAGGVFVFVERGNTLDNNGFVATHDGLPTLGTDPLTFVQFSGAGMIIAGEGLSKDGNEMWVNVDDSTIEITADFLNIKDLGVLNQHIANGTIDLTTKVQQQLDVIFGGTGLASVPVNSILYGDGTNDLKTITAPVDPDASFYLRYDASGVPTPSNVIDGGVY